MEAKLDDTVLSGNVNFAASSDEIRTLQERYWPTDKKSDSRERHSLEEQSFTDR